MPVLVQTVVSTVTALWGRSFVREANGQFRLLKVGDVLQRGDIILTEQNAIAQLSTAPDAVAAPVPVRLARAVTAPATEIDRTIDGLERGELNFLTAAGSRAADGGLTEATRVDRVVEGLSPGFGLSSGNAQALSVSPSLLSDAAPLTVAAPIPARTRAGMQQMGDAEVTEGTALVFTVQLTQATDEALTLPLTVTFGTAGAVDVGTLLFSDGVQSLPDGTVTVPAGVSSFFITLPTVNDNAVEATERLTLTLGGVTATGTILDNDVPRVVAVDAAGPLLTGDAVVEGEALTYTVRLSDTTTAPLELPFALLGGTVSADDYRAPAFSNGVVLLDNGLLRLPAGVSTFTVSVPTVDDSRVEPVESLTLSVGGLSDDGLIVDNDQPSVTSVVPAPGSLGSARVPEGEDLRYAVTLSEATQQPARYSFSLGGGTAAADDFGPPRFDNGVVLNADGTITVPAGVRAFTVSVPTTQDRTVEPDETVPLAVGGLAGTGTIVDDDTAAPPPTVISVQVGPPGLGRPQVVEGDVLQYTVTLSGATVAPIDLPFTWGGGTASAADVGQPLFGNGVTLNPDGTLRVPAGVSSFTIEVPSTQDTLVEDTETVPLSVGGATATGLIIDDDATVPAPPPPPPPAPPTVTSIEPGLPGIADDRVTEGNPLTFNVTLSGPTTAVTVYPFNLGGGSASAGDIEPPTFTNGVTQNLDGSISVPAGVTTFSVTVPTVQDTLVESDETVPLSVGGKAATGTIVDDDVAPPPPPPPVPPTVTSIEPGQPGVTDDKVTEGNPLTFNVTLSGPTTVVTVYPFNLGGGSASAGDIGTPTFSNGVTRNPDGSISVPAGVTTFSVTVPTVQDSFVESDETVPLSIGDKTATGTIVDDDVAPPPPPPPVPPTVTSIEPGQPGVTDDKVTEGNPLTFNVTLSGPTTAVTVYPFNLGGGSASPGDIGAPTFSNGVTRNPDGSISVPAGVTTFSVTVPTVQDTTDEPDETVPLSIGDKTATGTIVDDDGAPPPPPPPVPPTVTSIEPGQPGTADDKVTEGNPLTFNVTLSGPTAAVTTYPFNLGGGSASAGDIGAPTFTNGVTRNPDGSISVPPGVTTFSVTVPTIQDTSVESDETVPLSIGSKTATGTIVDDDVAPPPPPPPVPPTVTSIEPGLPGLAGDKVTEGNPLTFSVTLSGPTTAVTTYPFILGGGSASPGDIGAPTFSGGVSLNPDGTISVPAGITTFWVTVPTVQDTTVEQDETVPLSIGGKTATGTILDDDAAPPPPPPPVPPTVTRIEPGQPGVADDKVTEGNPLTFNVTLSGPTTAVTTYPFILGGGSASPGDIGAPTFTNGVTLNSNGTISVPPGVTTFSVTVPTVQDTTDEPDETVPLSIGGKTATGTIVDDDAAPPPPPPVPPTVTSIEPGQPGTADDKVTEGNPLTFNVTLSGPTTAVTTYPFILGGGSASPGDIGAPTFSGGVSLNPDGTISVPAGITTFWVTVPTVQDTTVEQDETVPLSIGGKTATGTIVDDDAAPPPPPPVPPTVTSIEPGQPGTADDKVTEGNPLTFNVTLSGPTTSVTTYPFILGGGSASPGDIGAPTFTNGVTLNPNGTISVPAGVTSFSVTVPTVQDTADEPDETVPLSIGGKTATGTIVDDDVAPPPPPPVPPTVTSIEPGQPGTADDKVTEGNPLTFNVTLSGPTTSVTTYPFGLGGGSASPGDIGAPTFTNGVTLNPNGTISVPAGVTTFSVTVPTVQDTTDESDETVPLSIGGKTATGTIVDDDVAPPPPPPPVPPTVTSIEPGQPGTADDKVTEGNPLTFNVTLSGPTTVVTKYPISLGGGSASAGDIGAPTFTNGVTRNPDGSISVPPGVTTFSVTVPTIQDTSVESDETVPLSIGGKTATGTIVDDDVAPPPPPPPVPPTVTSIEPGQPGTADDKVTEGNPLTFNVTLSGPTTAVTTYPFILGGGSASPGDIGAPTFTNGVTLNPNGTISVPPGVTTFSVTVPTVQDTADEPDETVPLSIGGKTATGIIVDDDVAPPPPPPPVPPTVTSIEPGQPGTADDKVTEGNPLTFNVTLSGPTTVVTKYPFSLGGGSASAGDIGAPTFTNGVTRNPDGSISVPAGVTTFSVTVPTVQDTAVEPDETVPLSIGGKTATGTIVDNDCVPPPTVTCVELGEPGAVGDKVSEGSPLTYNVSLSGQTTASTSYAFTLGGGTASAGDFGQPVFSHGVTLNANGTVTVPAGVSRFSVTVPTTQDTTVEPDETVPLSVGGKSAIGTIVDDDVKVIPVIDAGTVNGNEDQSLALKWDHFGQAPAGTTWQSLRFSQLPADGKLQLCVNGGWRDVLVNENITRSSVDAGHLRFVPDANESGAVVLGRSGVGNGKDTYAVLKYDAYQGDGQLVANGSMGVDIRPLADTAAKLTSNVMSAHGGGAPAGHKEYEFVLADGTPVASSNPAGYKGAWHFVSLQSTKLSTDNDGSEKAFFQLKVNQLDVASSPSIMALNDGTILKASADGTFWVAADQAEKVWLFRQEGRGPNGNQHSHQSVTATTWNAELDASGNIVHKVQGNTITSSSNTPLVLDLDGNGIQTVDSKAGAAFDFDGDGLRQTTGWVGKGDGLLVRDINSDGVINDGRELFGDRVEVAGGGRASDGYAALRSLDTNQDGVISASDAGFSQLKVWVDRNGDGISQGGELLTLQEAGVQSMNLQAQRSDQFDNGNHIALVSDYTRTDGSVHAMADVWFGAQHEEPAPPTAQTPPAEPVVPAGAFGSEVFAWQLGAPQGDAGSQWMSPSETGSGLDLRDLLGGDMGADAQALQAYLDSPQPVELAQSAAGSGPALVPKDALTQGAGPDVNPDARTELAMGLGLGGSEDSALRELLNRDKTDFNV